MTWSYLLNWPKEATLYHWNSPFCTRPQPKRYHAIFALLRIVQRRPEKGPTRAQHPPPCMYTTEIIKSRSAMRNPHRQQSLCLPADLPDLPLICHICQLICQICHWSARSANDLPMICQICHWSSRSTTDLPDLPMICQWSARSNKEMPEFFFLGGVICQNVITSRLFSNFPPHHQGRPTYHPKTLICQKKNWGKKKSSLDHTAPRQIQ